MSEVNAETLNVAVAEESTHGTIPSTNWTNIEPNELSGTEATINKQARTPFTITRQLRRSFKAGVDVGLSMELDVTLDHILLFAEAMFKSNLKHSGGTGLAVFRPTAATATGFTVAALGNLADGTLVASFGWPEDENNGVFVVDGASGTEITVAGGLTANGAPPSNVLVLVVGFQFAAGDLELDVDGNLTTTAKNLTQLGLNKGQWIYLGGADEIDPPYRFDDADYFGHAKIALTPAANKLTLARRSWTVGAPDNGGTRTIRLFYTAWIRNVARLHADEKLVSHSFEIAYPGLSAGPAAAYRYKAGCMLNTCAFAMPAEGKMTMQLEFIGKTTTDPSPDRLAGPSSARDVVSELAISTSSDINRLSVEEVDESGLMTDFADISLTVNNNITPADAVGFEGNRFTPLGVFQVDVAANAYFTTEEIATAVSDNRILRLAAGGRNDEFGLLIDVPSTGELAAPESIQHNQLVTVNASIQGFIDRHEAYTAGMSLFGYLPTRAPGLET
jgi:hypothetical protein